MSEEIGIRPATSADVAALVGLVRGYWDFEGIDGFDPVQVEALLRELLDAPVHGRIWLATVSGRPSAYLLGVYIFSLEFRGMTAEIDEFYVLPAHRGLGLGTRLLATAEEAFRAAGCRYLALRIGRDNGAARGFYQRHGFRERNGFDIIDKTL